jgi:Icc-related predicted phosphoesterase
VSSQEDKQVIFSAFSDTHGDRPPAISADVVLHAGDIYEDDAHISGVKAWAELPQRTLAIRGNHDGFDPVGFFNSREFTVTALDDKIWVVGIGFATQDLSYGPFAVPTERKLSEIAANVLAETVDVIPPNAQTILLSHYAPTSVFASAREGFIFDCIPKMCKALRPVALLYGHIHQFFGRECIVEGTPAYSLGPKGLTFTVDDGTIHVRR